MSTIETNLVQPSTGTTLTLGASGDTVDLSNAAVTLPDSAYLANRNMIINGAMQVSQRSTSVQKQYNTSNGYFTCDRVRTSQGYLDNAVWTMTQDSHLLTGPAGFPNSWKITVDTAETALASDEHLSFQYNIEANSCQNLAYGTAGAKTTTTSFWVKSDVTGTYSFYFYSYDAGRSIGGTYTISSADTWEYKTVTLVGDTAGTGINNDSGVGVSLYFALSAGTDRTATDNTTWGTHGSGRNAYGQTANLLASATDYWQITGLQFEIGSVATPFEHKTYGQELAACQRYYREIAGYTGVGRNSTPTIRVSCPISPEMRATPSVALGGSNNFQDGDGTVIAGDGLSNLSSTSSAYAGLFTVSGTAPQAHRPYIHAASSGGTSKLDAELSQENTYDNSNRYKRI